jgi:hypothetical protein
VIASSVIRSRGNRPQFAASCCTAASADARRTRPTDCRRRDTGGGRPDRRQAREGDRCHRFRHDLTPESTPLRRPLREQHGHGTGTAKTSRSVRVPWQLRGPQIRRGHIVIRPLPFGWPSSRQSSSAARRRAFLPRGSARADRRPPACRAVWPTRLGWRSGRSRNARRLERSR